MVHFWNVDQSHVNLDPHTSQPAWLKAVYLKESEQRLNRAVISYQSMNGPYFDATPENLASILKSQHPPQFVHSAVPALNKHADQKTKRPKIFSIGPGCSGGALATKPAA